MTHVKNAILAAARLLYTAIAFVLLAIILVFRNAAMLVSYVAIRLLLLRRETQRRLGK